MIIKGGNMAAVQVSARIDEGIKQSAGAVLAHYGLDIPAVIKMLVTQIATERRIPLDISQPVCSLNGDEFDSDQEYFEQIPGFLDKLDAASASKKRYSREEIGL
jgi:addiction module RelB/DinJ family antitoxin